MIQYLIDHPVALGLLLVWLIPWKGVALWKSARLHQMNWFIALLILNTMGILEIIYIFFVARKQSLEVEERPEILPTTEE